MKCIAIEESSDSERFYSSYHDHYLIDVTCECCEQKYLQTNVHNYETKDFTIPQHFLNV